MVASATRWLDMSCMGSALRRESDGDDRGGDL